MSSPIEILVHISGPSRGPDDARYRREASGLLAFEAVRRHDILRNDSNNDEETRNGRQLSQEIAITDHGLGQRNRVSALRQAFEQDLEGLTPAKPPLETKLVQRTPALPPLPFSDIKETPHLLVARTPLLPQPRPRTAPSASTPAQKGPPLRRTQSDSWHTPPSVIPDSQPTPSPNSGPHISSSPCLKRHFQSSSPSPTRHEEPNEKRVRVQVDSSPPSILAAEERLKPSSPAQHARPTVTHARVQANAPPCPHNNATKAFRSSPPPNPPLATWPPPTSSIQPPHPTPSLAKFKTHLATSLLTLSTIPSLVRTYRPIRPYRPLEALERGHWVLPISTWPDTLKVKFWEYMEKFLGGAQEGWGIRCFREMGVGSEGEVLKVYCWGEVVREVWFLLFIASERRVKACGVRWVDAGGVVVVEMP